MIEDPRIGKDVIESLTIGMYEDCRFIYREYIQNSADQVDKAISLGLLKPGEEEIHIYIDKDKKEITIEDNATGIQKDLVVPILRNIAHSTKKRGEDKGFRGIGRLGGLGYCAKLIFETSYKGESEATTMIWDASLLKQIINDRSQTEEATDVLSKVTSVHYSKEGKSKHYFKVTLQGVTSSDLLNIDLVRDYLSMVAPVDISSQFIYRNKIKAFVQEHNLRVDTYNIYINGDQIFKPYTNNIYEDSQGNKKKIDDILDVDFLLAEDSDGNVLYWGWYSLSRLNGQMKQRNIARGIRLRKENIQIGDEEICKKFFVNTSDQRFSFYFFGEIHAISKELIPNSRRDYFGETEFLKEFERMVRHDFMRLREMCYDASDIKKSQKAIAKKEEIEEKIKQKEQEGYSSKGERVALQKQLEEQVKRSDEAQKVLTKKKLKLQESNSPLNNIIDQLVPEIKEPALVSTSGIQAKDESIIETKTTFITDKPIYSRYSKNERKLIGRIYASIARAISDDGLRDAIIKIVEEDLTK